MERASSQLLPPLVCLHFRASSLEKSFPPAWRHHPHNTPATPAFTANTKTVNTEPTPSRPRIHQQTPPLKSSLRALFNGGIRSQIHGLQPINASPPSRRNTPPGTVHSCRFSPLNGPDIPIPICSHPNEPTKPRWLKRSRRDLHNHQVGLHIHVFCVENAFCLSMPSTPHRSPVNTGDRPL